VGVHEARYAPLRSIADGPSDVEAVRVTPWMTRLLGSGVDHDGVTPMLVLREHEVEVVDVFPMGGDALLEAEATGTGRVRTRLTGAWGSRPDVLRGAIAGKAYDPQAGVVCHGLVVLLCAVSVETTAGAWVVDRTAFVTSSDRGATWQLHSEDAPVQPGAGRVRSWSMQNWWPLTRGSSPLEAWFVAADYRYRGPGAADAHGGRVLMFRATREWVGGGWTLEPTSVAIESSNGQGEHAHSAGLVRFGAGGLRVVAAFGDGLLYSRMTSATRADHAYGMPGWSVDHAYHGSLLTSGFQFVGCAPGPGAGEMLLGADEAGQRIMRIVPDASGQSRARVERVYGEGFQRGPGSRVFLIRTASPEAGGPYVATFAAGIEQYPSDSQRVLYSGDGAAWSEAFAPGAAHEPAIHAGHIYMDSLTGGGGVRRIQTPRSRELRPLSVGRGGMNRMGSGTGSPSPADTQNEMRLLSAAERAALVPRPPTKGPVYEVRATSGGGWLVGRWRLCGAGGVLEPGAFLTRAWVMATSAESVDVTWRWGNGLSWTAERAAPGIIAQDSWSPLAMWGSFAPEHGGSYAPELLFTKPLGLVYSAYVAFDSVTEGTMTPGYALTGGAMGPNEVCAVAGVMTSPTWTIALAGQVPEDSWDASTPSPSRWTLASVRSDTENGIELVADVSGKKLVARVTRGGMPAGSMEIAGAFFLRGSQVRVCLAGTPSGIEMSATVGMRPIASASLPFGLLAPPSEVRFTSLDQTSVAPFEWFGGMIDPARARDGAGRSEALRSLAFLSPVQVVPGDTNGDGRVDFADLNAVLGAFGQTGVALSADVTGDGRVDFVDLNVVLGSFGSGAR